MNNKGFTLIELVAIILVLVAIFLVSFPNLLSMSKNDKDKLYDNMIKDLCLAGESYIKANVGSYSELNDIGSNIQISVNSLISYGNVKSGIINPNTNKKVDNDKLIFTVMSDNSLNCKYLEV